MNKEQDKNMNTVPMSLSSAVNVIDFAKSEGISIPEAADRLVMTGRSRIVAQRKWRTKDRRRSGVSRRT